MGLFSILKKNEFWDRAVTNSTTTSTMPTIYLTCHNRSYLKISHSKCREVIKVKIVNYFNVSCYDSTKIEIPLSEAQGFIDYLRAVLSRILLMNSYKTLKGKVGVDYNYMHYKCGKMRLDICNSRDGRIEFDLSEGKTCTSCHFKRVRHSDLEKFLTKSIRRLERLL